MSAAAEVAIAAAVADLRELIRPGRILLLGEWHGTNEWPALVRSIVDVSLAQGHDTIVALEVPMSHDMAQGAAGAFFERAPEYQDGRSSQAMAELADYVAVTAARTSVAATATATTEASLHPVALAGPWVAPGSPVPLHLLDHLGQPQDELMAANLMAVLDRHPKSFTVVLAGSEHTQVIRRADVPESSVDASGRIIGAATLGSILSAWYPRTVALLARARGGQTWRRLADGTAGPIDVPDDADLEPGAFWSTKPGADGHHGYVHLGVLSPSPPATRL